MLVVCPICNRKVETATELQEGQHVVCSYCKSKFEFRQNGCCPARETKKTSFGKTHEKTNGVGVDIGTWTQEQKKLDLLGSIKQQISVVIFLLVLIVLGQIGGCNLLSDIKNKSYEIRSY